MEHNRQASLNSVIDGAIDALQALKNIVVNVGQGGVDLGQDVVADVNGAIDKAIDKLQEAKG